MALGLEAKTSSTSETIYWLCLSRRAEVYLISFVSSDFDFQKFVTFSTKKQGHNLINEKTDVIAALCQDSAGMTILGSKNCIVKNDVGTIRVH